MGKDVSNLCLRLRGLAVSWPLVLLLSVALGDDL